MPVGFGSRNRFLSADRIELRFRAAAAFHCFAGGTDAHDGAGRTGGPSMREGSCFYGPDEAGQQGIATAGEAADPLARARELALGDKAAVAEARRLAEAEIRRDPTSYAALDLEAELLASQREWSLAQRLLDEYIQYYPENSDAAARLAWIYWRQGRREDALAELKAALARDPANLRGRDWLIEFAAAMGDHALVVATAEAGLETSPENRGWWLALGRARAHQLREAEARRAFEQALALGPDSTAACAYGEFLLDQNHSGEAARLLEHYASVPGADPLLRLRCADGLFRSNQPRPALEHIAFLSCDPTADSEKLQREVLAVLFRETGLDHGDRFAMGVIESGQALDTFAVEFLERCGARNNRGHLIKLFGHLGRNPQRYPRAMARFLSTYHEAPLVPGAVGRWVRDNAAAIDGHTVLWGGVGAWMVATGNNYGAVDHLGRFPQRRDVRPWMLLLLARAHEAVGQVPQANAVYRIAIQMPPDHSESALRSRLAFNLALDGLPAAGLLVAMDGSDEGKRLATAEDYARLAAVEALSRLPKLESLEERQELLRETIKSMKEFQQRDGAATIKPILVEFRRAYVARIYQ